jgi:hypothetical protein
MKLSLGQICGNARRVTDEAHPLRLMVSSGKGKPLDGGGGAE